ncbi:MAG TPA: DUF6599 family protein [Bryobacteraceae bacterium]|nr:DUF6599 family protein [Bryobacteraceae bacterium]
MLRCLIAQAFLSAILFVPLHGAIWPDQFGVYKKVSSKAVGAPDPALMQEYGFEAGEQAEYKSPTGAFTGTAWRLQDSTGALATFQWMRPADAKPSSISKLAARTDKGLLFAFGNYVFEFSGYTPTPEQLNEFYSILPRLGSAALPVISTYLPPDHLVPNSERYILGPVSLERFDPRIPPSVAAFHFGAEAQLGRYHTAKGDFNLAIFAYPTPDIARDRVKEFEKISGAVVKRAGPMVAVILSPPDPDAAERVLAQVDYRVSITLNTGVPPKVDQNVATMLINIFALAGIVLALCVGAGIAFGGLRVLRSRFGHKDLEEPMILLHLSDK